MKVLKPDAGWHEMHDLNTTDMHPFIHPFNPATDPPCALGNPDQPGAV